MSIIKELGKAIRVTIVLWVLVALLYPLTVFALGQVAFPDQANGSLLTNNQGETIGSALIGQPFHNDRYFWSRPSAIAYSTANPGSDTAGLLKTGISGASNLAPSNPALKERIQSDRAILEQAGISPIADLLYTSGSGLDPHISPAAAQAQIDRIAQARNLDEAEVASLIQTYTEGRFLRLFGEPGVNVLRLNLALDAL